MQSIDCWVPHPPGPCRQVLVCGVDSRRVFVFAARVGEFASGNLTTRVPQVSILRPGIDLRIATLLLALFVSALTGCGMPGAPQPPSLNLPVPVNDLSAVRAGNQVALTWSMPTRNTDKLLLLANVAVRICRNQPSAANCSAIASLQLAPGADGSFTDALPPELTAGSPHILNYFVELDNRKGRSAGLSNAAPILAGATPPPVSGLTVAMRPDGVLLSWAPAPPGSSPVSIRLERMLLTPPAKKPAQGPLAPPPEALEQNLLVESGAPSDRALDTHIRFGETYEYRAQRVIRLTVNGQTLELASALSPPVAHRRREHLSSRRPRRPGRSGRSSRERRSTGNRSQLASSYQRRSRWLHRLSPRPRSRR